MVDTAWDLSKLQHEGAQPGFLAVLLRDRAPLLRLTQLSHPCLSQHPWVPAGSSPKPQSRRQMREEERRHHQSLS